MNGFMSMMRLNNINSRSLAGPLIIVMLLSMMILPLPAIALDVLFSFNIALSIMVLLISLQTAKPLEFLAFPSVLLVTTMLRLSLNVASTRVVLTVGHTGPDAAGVSRPATVSRQPACRLQTPKWRTAETSIDSQRGPPSSAAPP